MRHTSQRSALFATILAGTLHSARVVAAPPAPSPPSAPAAGPAALDGRAEALVHFNRGSGAYNEGKWDIALAEFQEARRLYPGARGALDAAALCLEKLERHPEALDAYEAELREFEQTIPPASKQDVEDKVAALKKLVGTVEIQETEAGATISVDGQTIGVYPLPAPLRVKAGSHRLRVYKEGFEPFEQRFEVAGGAKKDLLVPLKALGQAGRLRVSEQRQKKVSVFVDGDAVGETPWDGPLAVGEHVVLLRGEGIVGSQPASVSVKLGQRAHLVLAVEELPAALRVEPTPAGASVAIDAATVGEGIWEGRVRGGKHVIEVTAPGFFSNREEAVIDRGARRVLKVALQRDPNSPFWPKPPRKPRFIAEIGTALTIVPSFGGDVAGGCIADCTTSAGIGGEGVIHGGYELASGLGFGVKAGLLTAAQNVNGRDTRLNKSDKTIDLGSADDRLSLRAVLVGGWVGWSFSERPSFHARLGGGGVIGTLEDARSFMGHAGDGAPFYAGVVVETHRAYFACIEPELRVGLPLSPHVEVNLGVAMSVLIKISNPRWGHGPGFDEPHLIFAGSDRAGTFPPDELTGRVFVLFAPGVGARYEF